MAAYGPGLNRDIIKTCVLHHRLRHECFDHRPICGCEDRLAFRYNAQFERAINAPAIYEREVGSAYDFKAQAEGIAIAFEPYSDTYWA